MNLKFFRNRSSNENENRANSESNEPLSKSRRDLLEKGVIVGFSFAVILAYDFIENSLQPKLPKFNASAIPLITTQGIPSDFLSQLETRPRITMSFVDVIGRLQDGGVTLYFDGLGKSNGNNFPAEFYISAQNTGGKTASGPLELSSFQLESIAVGYSNPLAYMQLNSTSSVSGQKGTAEIRLLNLNTSQSEVYMLENEGVTTKIIQFQANSPTDINGVSVGNITSEGVWLKDKSGSYGPYTMGQQTSIQGVSIVDIASDYSSVWLGEKV